MSKQVKIAIAAGIIIVVAVAAFFGVKSFVHFGDEGMLPTWYKGDSWTYQLTTPDGTTELVYENLGEGIYGDANVYLLGCSTTESSQSSFMSSSFIDTKTLETIEQDQSSTENGISFFQKTVFNGAIIEGKHWPLNPGRGWKLRNNTLVTTKKGIEVSFEQKETVHSYRVEKIEPVETPAGKFYCFKIVERDEQDKPVATYWYADRVKRAVKYQLTVEGQVHSYELQSYRISEEPPATPFPPLTITKSLLYEDAKHSYLLYYPPNWQVFTREETDSTSLITMEGAHELPCGSIDIRSVPLLAEATLDMAYEDILKITRNSDSHFILWDTVRIPAALPWHDLTWYSKMNDINTKGKTLVIAKDQKLIIVTGWVQEEFQETFYPQLQQILGSFGIISQPLSP